MQKKKNEVKCSFHSRVILICVVGLLQVLSLWFNSSANKSVSSPITVALRCIAIFKAASTIKRSALASQYVHFYELFSQHLCECPLFCLFASRLSFGTVNFFPNFPFALLIRVGKLPFCSSDTCWSFWWTKHIHGIQLYNVAYSEPSRKICTIVISLTTSYVFSMVFSV